MPQIFGTDAYRNLLASELRLCSCTAELISAYVTTGGVEWVIEKLSPTTHCRVVTRWNCSDLLNGASDIGVYEVLRKRNYELFILRDLHAKLVLLDRDTVCIGSANVTNNGLKLVPGGNRELGVVFDAEPQHIEIVNALFNDSVRVTDELFQLISTELDVLRTSLNKTELGWSAKLNELLRPMPRHLWVAELPWSEFPADLSRSGDDPARLHDLELLGAPENVQFYSDELGATLFRRAAGDH